MNSGSRTYDVIYIEDNASNAHLMEEMLAKRHNLHLQIACDAESGLELVDQHKPDFVLMDIDLPGISGIEALLRLKSRLDTREIPVVAVTASAMPTDIRAGLKAGFYDYLTKPITMSELFRLIDHLQEYIDHRQRGAEYTKGGLINQTRS